MAPVTRRGQYPLADPSTAYGAGETSLYNPLRSNLDWQGAIADTAQQAGEGIRGEIDKVIDDAVEAIKAATGIDLSSLAALVEQILDVPLSVLDSTPLGAGLGVLSQFLPFLPGADPSTFDPTTAAASFITDILNPANLIPLLTGGLLAGTVIPGLDASKIISGVFGTGLIPGLDASKIITGVFGGSLIPGLDASKITSGTFPQSMIAGLTDALSNAGGALADAIVQALGGSGTGHDADDVLAALQAIPGANIIGSIAASLISGVLGAGQIPGLDASKISSGTFADGLLPGLGALRDAVVQAINGGSSTGNTAAQVKSALQAIPGGNIASAIAAAIVPALDASKITTGTFGAGLIPGLDAAKIISGTFAQSMVSGLSTIASNASNAIAGLINFTNTWTGGSGATGDPAEVASTTAQIKAAIAAGYNVTIFSTSNSAWTVPTGTVSLIGCVMNGGGKGANGNATGVGNGGAGGSSGGYLSANLDMTGITPGSSTLNITVGAAATTAGTGGGVSSIKFGATTLLAGSANANGIASNQGLIGTTSTPGKGGNGGNAAGGTGAGGNGTAGESSGVATGGVGGTGAPAGTGAPPASAKGGDGGAGTSGSVPLCGGAGGGGGGGKNSGSSIQNPQGGAGGNGGYPGGGSGGGGAANNTGGLETPGQSGTPAIGIVAILHK
ncbi:hypothetical protein [Mycolicibacterium mageritense]|uniref:hypothetical protein n=1 Tax=Mycolicibacterium mageritense TaxID=53462 RepID=UPI001E52E06C|nr:hypothetical protein [Mycolicibacterium mageritense]GJJ24094.1 hypothetical protein MTY414_77680 [Mycolicibacterium mageritense]